MKNKFALTALVLGLLSCIILAQLLMGSTMQNLKSNARDAAIVGKWNQWQQRLQSPAFKMYSDKAQAYVKQLQALVDTTSPGAVVSLIGSYMTNSFQPQYSDIDIRITVPDTDLLKLAQQLQLPGNGNFQFQHTTSKYMLLEQVPQDKDSPKVDVTLVPFSKGSSDGAVRGKQDFITREAFGFLNTLIREPFSNRHVTVRQWRPHLKMP